MNNTVAKHLISLFQAHLDLAQALPVEAFVKKLPVPSSVIGQQFWCIIGARESYTKALERGEWSGFSCSLSRENIGDKQVVINALQNSAEKAQEVLCSLVELSPEQENTLVDLLEHESQHQGQLIRYVYGLGLEFPQSWKDRWHL